MSRTSQAGLKVALIHEVFPGPDGEGLLRHLVDARQRGAELALLPELPLDRWAPATPTPDDADAEPPGGPRHQALATAASAAGIGVAGGAIVVDAATGERRNRLLLFSATGDLLASYDKLHVPHEDGFWEAAHYATGNDAPDMIDGFGLRVGLQICSDLFRPVGCHLLGARGAEVILSPRATPATSYARWRDIIRNDALTSGCYVLSVNRPRPEQDVAFGGASVAAGPDGRVLLETTEPVSVVTLERSAVARAAKEYPGYLAVRSDLYAHAWAETAD